MTPPSLSEIGGSGTIVVSIRFRRSLNSSTVACRIFSRSAAKCASEVRKLGSRASEAASASTSRGFAVSSVTRLSNRSKSRIPSRARRSSSRAMVSFTWASTASRRALISALSIEGRRIQERSKRLPMGVTVTSMERERVTPTSVPANSGSISSRFRTVTASSTRQFCCS